MIRFTQEMKTHIPHIDAQHESLVDFANRAATLSASGPRAEDVRECLDFLGAYAVRHFSDEEKLQQECHYPRYAQHRAIHEEFVRMFGSMCAEFDKYGPSELLSSAIEKRVSNWIITHIRGEDAAFGRYYAAWKQGG